jgi:Fic family protein
MCHNVPIYIAFFSTIWHNILKEDETLLSYELTPELLESLQTLEGELSLVYAKLSSLPDEERNSIHRYARISMIGASTRIENAQLTDSEIDWLDTILTKDGKTTALEANRDLIENKLSKDRERSIEEVAGCRQLLLSIYENPKDFFPIRESDLRGLHYQLMSPYKGAGPIIGEYKVQTNSVVEHNRLTGQIRTVFQTAEAGVITNTAMAELVAWYNKTLPLERWPLAVACELVFRFLAIHPFQDGNGRLGRGLFLVSLLQCPQPILSNVARYLAIDRQIEKHKEEYYFVLNSCSNGKFSQDPSEYKIGYFLRFMIKVLWEAAADINVYQNKYRKEQDLSPSASRVLSCFRDNPETRLKTKLIIEMTGFPRRTVGNALSELFQFGLIQKYGKGAGVRYQITF